MGLVVIEFAYLDHQYLHRNAMDFLFISADSASQIIKMLKNSKDWQTDVCTKKIWNEYGIVMYSGFDQLRFFESTEYKLIGPNGLKFKENDRVKMKHTFKSSKCELFYNGKSVGFFVMNGKSIQPYISQYYANV